MLKLLILADDLTGALDTGVQLAKQGIAAPVFPADTAGETVSGAAGLGVQVAVRDLGTRHVTPQQAYRRVYSAVARAVRDGVRYIYKKTDSGLRGNIGAELQAVVDACGGETLAFVPAFPQMGRVTRGGVQYAGGVPVSMSSFGRDLLNPVRFDAVQAIVAEQSGVSVHLFTGAEAFAQMDSMPAGLLLFDAETVDDLRRIAQVLKERSIRLFAGCAALANFLPHMLPLASEEWAVPAPPPDMLIVSGSISPLSFAQAGAAQASGIPAMSLTAGERFSTEPQKVAGRLLPGLRSAYARQGTVLLCACASQADVVNSAEVENLHGHIAGILARTAYDFYRGGGRPTLVVNGGDTLAAVTHAFGAVRVEPVLELFDGIALSKLVMTSGELWMVSKSGNFGAETVYMDIHARLAGLAQGDG